ncbi:hypothetical protein BC940DRAFT_337333 [Gongronella butleri]|nr:hypothetical protein BC940DRAFT_337333 [Gongronella butleri]
MRFLALLSIVQLTWMATANMLFDDSDFENYGDDPDRPDEIVRFVLPCLDDVYPDCTTTTSNPGGTPYTLPTPLTGSLLGTRAMPCFFLNDTTRTDLLPNMLRRFDTFMFDNFITYGGQDILGPLAVGNMFSGPHYVVNANRGATCDNIEAELGGYGLVVRGTVVTEETDVHGQAFLAGGGSVTEVKEQEAGCEVVTDRGTGSVDFDAFETYLMQLSQIAANIPPNLKLDENGVLQGASAGDSSTGVHVLTFDTCNDNDCPLYPGSLSSAALPILGTGNWNGPQGMAFPDHDVLVFNVPVLSGSSITFGVNEPSNGHYNPCITVYNVYPSDAEGNFDPNGFITVNRNTGGQLGGMFLAPHAYIYDGSTGNFAGNLFGYNYTWQNPSAGVEIHDYHAAGGQCDYFGGCIVPPDVFPVTTTSAHSSSSSTSSDDTSSSHTTSITSTSSDSTTSNSSESSSSTDTLSTSGSRNPNSLSSSSSSEPSSSGSSSSSSSAHGSTTSTTSTTSPAPTCTPRPTTLPSWAVVKYKWCEYECKYVIVSVQGNIVDGLVDSKHLNKFGDDGDHAHDDENNDFDDDDDDYDGDDYDDDDDDDNDDEGYDKEYDDNVDDREKDDDDSYGKKSDKKKGIKWQKKVSKGGKKKQNGGKKQKGGKKKQNGGKKQKGSMKQKGGKK